MFYFELGYRGGGSRGNMPVLGIYVSKIKGNIPSPKNAVKGDCKLGVIDVEILIG
jgi:hypothetical protein